MKQFKSSLVAAILLSLAPPAHAAIVTLYMSIGDNNGQGALTGNYSSPGNWTLYATVSKNDNFGLASFFITLNRTTSITIDAPRTFYHDLRSDSGDPNANPDVSAGFTFLRSVDTDPFTHTVSLSGGQDIVEGTGYFIEHFGQSSGTLLPPPPGWDTSYGSVQTTYYNVLKLAHGTYSYDNSNPFSPLIFPQIVQGPNTRANVFALDRHGLVAQQIVAANIESVTAGSVMFIDFVGINPVPPLDVPEPAFISFLAFTPILLLRRRPKPA